MPTLSWLFALSLVLMALASAAATVWVLKVRRIRSKALPTDWDIAARAVFNTDERRVYRQLRDALPHHIVLAKLPLLRFSQAEDPQRMKYWYRVLGHLNVTFAICGANGRLLAALDLDNGRTPSRRTVTIKQSVLAACRVRYLRIPADHLPSIAELQLLVPQAGGTVRAPQARASRSMTAARVPARPAQAASPARPSARPAPFSASTFSPSTFRNPPSRDSTFSASTFGASTFKAASFDDSSFDESPFAESSHSLDRPRPAPLRPSSNPPMPSRTQPGTGGQQPNSVRPAAPRRAPAPRPTHTPLWQDSNFFQDSFFGTDDRPDLSAPSDFGAFDGDDFGQPFAAPLPPSARRIDQSGRLSGGQGTHGSPSSTSRDAASTRRPMRGRPRVPGEYTLSDSDIVGVVVDTHDVHRPAARRLLGNRDFD
ncbi:MAG: hypothetical protein JWQ11_4667 [Rhizobacter sp.]|nr:hypothetical protein [Rhizobacter sp.]